MGDAEIAVLARANLPALRELCVHSLDIGADARRHLATSTFARRETLAIASERGLHEGIAALVASRNFAHLTTLDLYAPITRDSVAAYASAPRFATLRRLSLRATTRGPEIAIAIAESHATNLRELVVTQSSVCGLRSCGLAGTIYTFGPFRLEVQERRLLRDGALLPLSGKAFDLLVELVESAGTLQRQQSLMERLWPDTFVEPNSLQYHVSLLRRVIDDSSGVEIQTVRGQGYRLVADVVHVHGDAVAPPASELQRTYFCKAADGARLAFAKLGDGPPIVKVANWLGHLELDWKGGVWKHLLELLARGRCLVRYDARGNGLSDWNPPSITFENFVSDLATVVEAAGIARAPVFGISQGAAIATAYAARHPDRVSALILVGGCARGWRVKGHTALAERFEALMVLMRQGWGGRNAAFRQIFTSAFFPDATPELAEWWNELQRQTTTPDNAASILSALGDVDVRAELARVDVPTLVLHSREDAVVPMKDGIELASGIAGARFVPLDSRNHMLLPDEPAWPRFVAEVERFLAQETLR